jgi:hypothetical protein
MGGWGSGRRKRPGRRLSLESCPVLDIRHLLAQGCLQPGWVGTCSEVSGSGEFASLIVLRAGVRQLYISWHPVNSPSPDSGPANSPANTPDSNSGSGPVSGLGSRSSGGSGSSSASTPDSGPDERSDDEFAGRAEVISIFHLTYPRCGARHYYFLCPGAGCGRRAFKLYLVRRRFLCRRCSGLVYASKTGQPWQHAFRRANRLRQRLGITAAGAPDKPKEMRMRAYERLLDAALKAEIQATEAGTARLRRLIAWIENRHKPPFTLD